MPRIRRLKNYEFELDESAHEANASSGQYEGIEVSQSQSWLSDANVICSFTDAQLRAAIQRYKILLSALEKELLTRSLGARFNFHQDGSVILKSGKRYRHVSASAAGTEVRPERQRQPKNKLKEFLKKSGIKNTDALLSVWHQILNPEGGD